MATGNRKDTNLNSLTIEEIDLKVKADVEAMLKVDIGDSKKAEQGNYVFFGFAGSKKFDITSFEIKENKFGIYAGGDVNTNSKIKSINYTLLKDSVHDNTIYYFDKFFAELNSKFDFEKINDKAKVKGCKPYSAFDKFFNLPPKSTAEKKSELGKLRITVLNDKNQSFYDFRFYKKISVQSDNKEIIKYDEMEKITKFEGLIDLFSRRGTYKVFVVPCNLTSEIGKQSVQMSWKLLAVQELGTSVSQLDELLNNSITSFDDEEFVNKVKEDNNNEIDYNSLLNNV